MRNLKLGVEVISAQLKPRNQKNRDYQSGHDAINAFVEIRFDDQKVKTTTKSDDSNPIWNEKFFFDISDSENLSNLILEAYLYNKSTKSCLGRVRIFGTAFLPYSEALGLHYPLEKEKWNVFSTTAAIAGELALKVFITDNPKPLNVPIQNPKIEIPSKPRHKSHNIPKTEKKHSPAKKNPHLKPPQPQPQTPQPQSPQSQLSQPQPQPVLQAMVAPTLQATRFASPTPPAMNSNPPANPNLVDYSIKETNPILGRSKQARATGHDLIEPMEFLFVKIVKARDLPRMDPTGSLDPYVEIKLGNFKAKTKQFEKNSNPIWNEVFAFTKHDQQSNSLEVTVMDKDMIRDDFVGTITFNLMAIPTRIASESPLAPEWYKLEKGGEIMLAIWFGTQTDEAFTDAIYSDAFNALNKSSVRSKTYHSPRLWYLRVHIIEAQDLVLTSRFPNVYVKIQLGNQIVRTKLSQNLNPKWNEEFTFVAAEPFEDLIFSIQNRVPVNQDETLGTHELPIATIDKRGDDRITVPSRWINLEKRQSVNGSQRRVRFATKLHLNVSLEGGYHVLDESTYYSSDFRSSMRLNQPSIGALQLGIIGVSGLNLLQEQGKETMDAYCVAKYGQKWVRTRTIMDNFTPRFNEQYTWEVYEPATVLTIGVFDNNQINGGLNKKDGKIGKLRIRISTLESDKIYTNSYPLLVLTPSGVKKMGEIHLAIRFTCTSTIQMILQYWKPLLPKMHYTRPLKVVQQEILRQHAVNLVATRLSRSEPPLKKEVVEYISDANSHFWSMRKSRANLYRLKSVFSCLFRFADWFQEICSWRKPMATVAVHMLYLAFVCVPEMILPIMCLCLFMIGLWNYRLRSRKPQEIDVRLSFADNVNVEELNEEFDTFPCSENLEIVRMRYERLRNIASRAQKVIGDVAGQGERVEALLSWRDPRATCVFMCCCLVSCVVLFAVPFKVFVLVWGLYVMRYPRFRGKMPSAFLNFFRRLPAKTDSML